MKRNTDRGVATVIGFAILFGILIISFSIYQGIVIPEQNNKAEFEHNERAQTDLLNLRQDILETGLNGIAQSGSITVGATYQQRSVGVNFAVTGGIVRTREPAPNSDNEILITNATAIDAETADYVNASTRAYPTKSIVYSPIYTRYSQAPDTVIAGGATTVFNEFENANLSIGDQMLIDDRTITIVVINGSLTKSKTGEGATVSVTTEPLSVATNRIVIENQTGRINITLPTRIDNVTAWNDSSLQSEFQPEGYIYDISKPSQGYISIILESGQYTLRMAKVGVGTKTKDTSGAYLIDTQRPQQTVLEGSSNLIKLEVRDKYNNPINGFQVNGSIYNSTAATNGTLRAFSGSGFTTNNKKSIPANTSNSVAVFNYTAPDISSRAEINLNFTIYRGVNSYEQVWVNFSVTSIGGQAGDITFNETAQNNITTGGSAPGSNGGNGDSFAFKLRNTGNSDVTITGFSVETTEADKLQAGGGPPPGDPEVLIDISSGGADGEANAMSYQADGTKYSLTKNATIPSGQNATASFVEFRPSPSWTNVERTDAANAEVTVTLFFKDGSQKEFYFKTT